MLFDLDHMPAVGRPNPEQQCRPQQAAAAGGVPPARHCREPPRGADGQTARAMLRSKQAPGVGGGQHKMLGEAAE